MRRIVLTTLVLSCLLGVAACSAPEKSRTAMEEMGFREVTCGGHAFLGCGDDYTYATHCRGTNALGSVVDAVVCCGILKGCSVKF